MLKGLTPKRIRRELVQTALDHVELGRLGKDKEVALSHAETAVALKDLLDLWDFDFVDKGLAVAVAAVGLERLRSVCHGSVSK